MKTVAITFIILSSCISAPKEPSLFNQAEDALNRGLLREAVELYQKSIHLENDTAYAQERLGVALYKSGDYKGSIKHIKKSLPQLEKKFEVHYVLGECFRLLKKYKKAIISYKKALTIEKNNLRALRSLAWVYWKKHNYKKALEIAERTNFEKKDEEMSIILLRIYISLKKFERAHELIEQVEWSQNHLSIVWSLQGDISYGEHKFDLAMELYKKALNTNPLLASALMGLGRCLKKKGDEEKAMNLMNKARKIRPKNPRKKMEIFKNSKDEILRAEAS